MFHKQLCPFQLKHINPLQYISELGLLFKLLSDQLRGWLFVQALEWSAQKPAFYPSSWVLVNLPWQNMAVENCTGKKSGFIYLFLFLWLGLEVVSKSLAKNAGLTAGHRVTRQCCKLKNKFRDNSWSCTLQMLPCRCVLKSSAYVDTYQGLLQSSLQEGDHHKCSMPTCTLMMKHQSPITISKRRTATCSSKQHLKQTLPCKRRVQMSSPLASERASQGESLWSFKWVRPWCLFCQAKKLH